MKHQRTDINLARDPRYAAAQARLAELQLEAVAIEQKRSDLYAAIAQQANADGTKSLTREAEALISGAEIAARVDLRAQLGDADHQLAVVREAIRLQREVLENLRGDISVAISRDMLPQHVENVRCVAEAAIALEAALAAEADLRDALHENGVLYSAAIRPMPMLGFGLLRDDQSRISRYLAECAEYGFLRPNELPDVVRARLPKKAPAEPKTPAGKFASDGWLNAA